jgi:hypothetical protein
LPMYCLFFFDLPLLITPFRCLVIKILLLHIFISFLLRNCFFRDCCEWRSGYAVLKLGSHKCLVHVCPFTDIHSIYQRFIVADERVSDWCLALN